MYKEEETNIWVGPYLFKVFSTSRKNQNKKITDFLVFLEKSYTEASPPNRPIT